MRPTRLITRWLVCSLALAGGVLSARGAGAVTYQLKTGTRTLTLPDGKSVEQWGFGLVGDAQVSVPGPLLEVPPGDTTLTIELTNNLSVPVSIVIPALPATMVPVWDDGTSGARSSATQRVRSFTHVAAASGGTATYQWTNVQPGTYLYQSGTHPAAQVPMGLYGAVKHDSASGSAYGGVSYDRELVLLYSEIDPGLNAAVAAGTFGTAAYPSAVDYAPKYFLVNGQPFTSTSPLSATVNERVLLRFLNAGLQSIVPTAVGSNLKLLAEDGQLAPFSVERYSLLLPAGKTRDALFLPRAAGSLVLFDRSLRTTSPGAQGGARIAKIDVAAAAGAPLAADDSYSLTEDSSLDTAAASLSGVLANDTGSGLQAVLVSDVLAGTLVLSSDGSFVYTPSANFSGSDFFTYYATDGASMSNVATVALSVSSVNDAPVAVADSYQAQPGTTLAVSAAGVLANDSDADMDTLQAVLVSGPSGGTLTLNSDGSFSYLASSGTTSDSFTYQASDGTLSSAVATVTITVSSPVNQAPTAVDDNGSTKRNTSVTISVSANDTDPDGSIDPASILIVTKPTRGGTVSPQSNGSVIFTPKANFLGTDTFSYSIKDNLGLVSANAATVRVNVTK